MERVEKTMVMEEEAGTFRLKKGALVRSLILTVLFLVLTFLAHGAEQKRRSGQRTAGL